MFDQISLGEVMLRLDPGEGRIRDARRFTTWAGGGEYNTSCGLYKVFGQRTAVVTALVDNEIGHLVEDFILQAGVETEFIQWREDDGMGRTVRNGLNFTERGYGPRGALGMSDRGHTAISQLRPGQVDWEHLFGTLGVRWFHTGGIFAALSETTCEVALEAVQAAQRHGTIVSYDFNFRPSLWKSIGGVEKAVAVNREIARHVDVMIDFSPMLLSAEMMEVHPSDLSLEDFQEMMRSAARAFPNFQVVANSRRKVVTASRNDWSVLVWHAGEIYQSRLYPALEILDRVGGGDSFVSGLQFAFLEYNDAEKAAEYGAAHGALAGTTPGDTSMMTRAEVEKHIACGGSRLVS